MTKSNVFVITCGDEGVQVNEGHRLAVAGAGYKVPHFADVVKAMKKVFGKDVTIAASAENDWIKAEMKLGDWGQVNASMQQQIEALADREGLKYVGMIPFADPQVLEHGVKAHMVRPHGIHVANKICFTLAGGEQTYNLGCYLISADWVSEVSPKIAKEVMEAQIAFYTKLAKKELKIVFEEAGPLGEKVAAANKKALEKIGIVAS